MKDYMLDPPDEDDEIVEGELLDDRDYLDEAEVRKELDIDDFNTPRGKWAPSDFVYDPLSRKGFE